MNFTYKGYEIQTIPMEEGIATEEYGIRIYKNGKIAHETGAIFDLNKPGWDEAEEWAKAYIDELEANEGAG